MESEWLILLAIPLVAAAVGYFTNWVAIWMLFRPHKEKRLFGVRVPFTPGLIPSRRLEMAERMGRAVAKHLITEEAVSARIDTPEVRAKVKEIISERLEELLSRELGPIETLIPEQFRGEWQGFTSEIRARVRAELERVLRQPETEEFIRGKLDARVEGWLMRPLGELLPEELLDELPSRVGDWLGRLVEGEEFEERVRSFLDEKIDSIMQEDKPLRAYIPDGLKEAAYEKMAELMPLMLERLASVLEDEKLKKRIKIQLYELVDRLLAETFDEESLWDQFKFGLMEIFLISTDELKHMIDQSVEEAAPRFAQLLGKDEVRLKVRHALLSSVDAFLEKRPSDFKVDPQLLSELKGRIASAVTSAARSPRMREQLIALMQARLEHYKRRSLKEIFPKLSAERLGPTLSHGLIRLLHDETTIEALTEFICARIEEWLARPIGRLRDHIPEEYVEKVQSWLSERALEVLKRETPKMVAAISIEKLVREKVNELPIAEVERLILAITSRQLRAITWFGALLGFIIGLIQVAIVLARGGL